MKKFYLSFIILIVTFGVYSQNVSIEEAHIIAQNFTRNNDLTILSLSKYNGENAPFYIFNQENGFVIIAGDKRCTPILAYSTQQSFDTENIAPAVEMWLQHYAQQINEIKANSSTNTTFDIRWNNLTINSMSKDSIIEIKPFLTSYWGQGKNFNYYCPQDDEGINGRTVTGCVATALSQIMYYYRFPESGTGSYSYLDSNYGVLSANFAESHYKYDQMVDKPYRINLAASRLIADCGIACDLVYGVDGTGMYNHKAAYAMRTHFKYSPNTEYIFRDSVNMDWDSLMVTTLNQYIPLYYAGWSVPNIMGHAFVCDGYQKMDSNLYYYHFNFGWDSSYDGYFYTASLHPGSNNFNLAQEIIIAYPDTALYTYQPASTTTGNITLNEEAASFTDGSGNIFEVAPNMDFTWNIAPQVENISKIILSMHYNLVVGDTIFIQSPDPNINYFLTDSYGIIEDEIMASTAVVRFKSGSQPIHSKGFTASYVTIYPEYCNNPVIHTTATGTANDKSGDNDYLNFTYCKTYISVNGYNALRLEFTEFDLADGDYLYIYDKRAGADTLLMTLSGQLGTPAYTLPSNRIMLVFSTNETETAEGWSLNYYAGTSGILEQNTLQFNIFPNPATDKTTIEISEMTTNSTYYVLQDIYGKIVQEGMLHNGKNEISINSLSNGLYIMHIKDEKKSGCRKLLIQ